MGNNISFEVFASDKFRIIGQVFIMDDTPSTEDIAMAQKIMHELEVHCEKINELE